MVSTTVKPQIRRYNDNESHPFGNAKCGYGGGCGYGNGYDDGWGDGYGYDDGGWKGEGK